MNIIDEIVRKVKIYEGYSDEPYKCPADKWTIGYGYNYEDRGFAAQYITEIIKNGFTEGLADILVKQDVLNCYEACEKNIKGFNDLDNNRRAVIVDMCYQLGLSGLLQFRKMLNAIAVHDYETASEEMQDSRWYKQSGRRSIANVKQMLTGENQEVT